MCEHNWEHRYSHFANDDDGVEAMLYNPVAHLRACNLQAVQELDLRSATAIPVTSGEPSGHLSPAMARMWQPKNALCVRLSVGMRYNAE
jgi:hypothetical protein